MLHEITKKQIYNKGEIKYSIQKTYDITDI